MVTPFFQKYLIMRIQLNHELMDANFDSGITGNRIKKSRSIILFKTTDIYNFQIKLLTNLLTKNLLKHLWL